MQSKMTLAAVVIAIASLFLLLVPSFGEDPEITVSGTIQDSQCAFNVHADGQSHDKMMKMLRAKSNDVITDEFCIRYCKEQMAGIYVLATEKHVYKLDDQVKPEKFIGGLVKITGTLDAEHNILHVVTIQRDKKK